MLLELPKMVGIVSEQFLNMCFTDTLPSIKLEYLINRAIYLLHGHNAPFLDANAHKLLADIRVMLRAIRILDTKTEII